VCKSALTQQAKGASGLRSILAISAFLMTTCLPCKSTGQAEQASAPTLAQTMAFLNEKLEQRGTIGTFTLNSYEHRVYSETFAGDGCEQTYKRVESGYTGDKNLSEKTTYLALARFDQADLSSVAILEPDENAKTYRVAINKVAHNWQKFYNPQPSVNVDLHTGEGDLLTGTVQSVDANSITVLIGHSGYPRKMMPDKSVVFHMGKLQADGKNPPKANMTDVSPGDELQVFAASSYDKHPRIYIEKHPGAATPTLPDPEKILPATRQVGPERKSFVFAYTNDRDEAERIAKATIHAITLCEASSKPSLF
jgi:hypothetical protein